MYFWEYFVTLRSLFFLTIFQLLDLLIQSMASKLVVSTTENVWFECPIIFAVDGHNKSWKLYQLYQKYQKCGMGPGNVIWSQFNWCADDDGYNLFDQLTSFPFFWLAQMVKIRVGVSLFVCGHKKRRKKVDFSLSLRLTWNERETFERLSYLISNLIFWDADCVCQLVVMMMMKTMEQLVVIVGCDLLPLTSRI